MLTAIDIHTTPAQAMTATTVSTMTCWTGSDRVNARAHALDRRRDRP